MENVGTRDQARVDVSPEDYYRCELLGGIINGRYYTLMMLHSSHSTDRILERFQINKCAHRHLRTSRCRCFFLKPGCDASKLNEKFKGMRPF